MITTVNILSLWNSLSFGAEPFLGRCTPRGRSVEWTWRKCLLLSADGNVADWNRSKPNLSKGQVRKATGRVTDLRRDQHRQLAFQVWLEKPTPFPYPFGVPDREGEPEEDLC